jgi:ParB/RepB/Spo0J family partition protein
MSDQTLQTLAIDRIKVADGFNARQHFDEQALAELADSIKADGLVHPPVVRPGENGDYVLVAGERRLRAAKLAELAEIPVLVRKNGSAEGAALAENIERVELNPIETARAIEALARAEGLSKRREIAKRLRKSESWVSAHLRLLALPDGVKPYFAAGTVPVGAEKVLREIAQVSEGVAAACCAVVASGEADAGDLVENPGAVVSAVAAAELDPPVEIVAISRGVELHEVVRDDEVVQDLSERLLAAREGGYEARSTYLRLEERDVDAIRAAGVLLELDDANGWYRYSFAVDRSVTQEVATQIVERTEREATKRRRAEAKAEREAAEAAGVDPDSENAVEKRKAKEREERKREHDAKRARNLAIGAKLLERKTAKARKEHALARAKAVARLVLADNAELPAAGLRYSMTQLQVVEVKTLKSGETREKVTHVDREQAMAYVVEQIERAKTANEVLEVLADCLIAGLEADQEELAFSRRVNWWCGVEDELRVELSDEIKEVKPRARRAKKG